MEEKLDKQTITNKNDASAIHKTIPQKSSTNTRSTEIQHVVEKKSKVLQQRLVQCLFSSCILPVPMV